MKEDIAENKAGESNGMCMNREAMQTINKSQ